MRVLIIILIIFLAACSKTDTFKVVANCENCTLDIIADDNNGYQLFTVNGDFKEKFKGTTIQVDIRPEVGTTATVEIFKNGELCASEYGYIGEDGKFIIVSC